MEQSTLDKCQSLIGYQFKDLQLLRTALTHASVAPTRLDSNERMEFLGDAVLGMVVCSRLYEKYPDLLEGEMTKIKSLVVSRKVCAEIAIETNLSPLLTFGKGMASQAGLPQSVSAAVLEAIIGAVYIDGGLEPARKFTLEHLDSRIDDAIEDKHRKNFKSLLQQCAQRRWNGTPEYHFLDEKGPDHDKCFEIAVVVDGRHFPSAWGNTKKEAEQEAARRALIELGMIEEDDEGNEGE